MNPVALLAAARLMAGSTDRKLGSHRLIAASILLRQSMEDGLDDHWGRVGLPALADCSARAQLITLPFYLEPEVLARDVVYCWHRLSATVHHDVYDLPPTIGEFDHMAEIVTSFLAAAGRISPTGSGGVRSVP